MVYASTYSSHSSFSAQTNNVWARLPMPWWKNSSDDETETLLELKAMKERINQAHETLLEKRKERRAAKRTKHD